MQCPFVYANGRRCTGTIWQARAYGKHQHGCVEKQNIRKIRLWCSEKNDHAGIDSSSYDAKNRMEFYPDDLHRRGILIEAIAACENVLSETAKA